MIRVIVYSKTACQACRLVMHQFDKRGIAYDCEKLADHPDVERRARDEGVSALPVVEVIEGEHHRMWGGPNLEEIKSLAAVCGAL